jgi:N4-gp56 family major capsid protein
MALTTSTSLSVNKAAYEKLAYYALRPELYYDSLVEVKPTNLTARGTSVQFTITSDLAAASTAISESADITAVAMSDSVITVTLLEYANAIQLTAKNKATAFYELNPIMAEVIGYNAGLSIDTVAQGVFQAGTNALYSQGTGSAQTDRFHLAVTNTLDGNVVRRAGATLAKNNVQRINGGWVGFIHPDVAYDFRGSTGGTNWSDPHVYGQDQTNLWNGYVGRFQGTQFIETPRAPLFVDGSAAGTARTSTTNASVATDTTTGLALITTTGAHALKVGDGVTFSGNGGVGLPNATGATVVTVPSTTTFTIAVAGVTTGAPSVTVTAGSVDVYGTLIIGRQAFAKAFSNGGGYGEQPIIGDTPVVDVAERFTGLYWKHFVGYGIFRQNAIYRVESSSSIGSN